LEKLRILRDMIGHKGHDLCPMELSSKLAEIGIVLPASDHPRFKDLLINAFNKTSGQYYIPSSVLTAISLLSEGLDANTVCDPWAGTGSVLSAICEATQASNAIAFTNSDDESSLGRYLLPSAAWQAGNPCTLLNALMNDLDIVASILPFGNKGIRHASLQASDGSIIKFDGDIGQQILATSAIKLSPNGIGIYVVPESLFSSKVSILPRFGELGLGIGAALALPPGIFAPYTNTQTYIVTVSKKLDNQMFVAELTTNVDTDRQIVVNYRHHQVGASRQLGCFVDTSSFTGISNLHRLERLERAESQFKYPAIHIRDIASAITLGRHGDNFQFPEHDNVIYLPIIGTSDVVDSVGSCKMKYQNYAQIVIDPEKSKAQFVARFLNTALGKEVRALNQMGHIPKLNTQSLKDIPIYIPNIYKQIDILEIDSRLQTEQNTVLSLHNEIVECRRDLWANLKSSADVVRRLDVLSARLSDGVRQQADDSLNKWFETLPFPMASILRIWQVTPDNNENKYEHLIRYFEASAEFIGTILLSAFSSREQVFREVLSELQEIMNDQHLSFTKATFGTWKAVIEFLGKKVRKMISSNDADQRALCMSMFADDTMQLPMVLCATKMVQIASSTNKMRNDWMGHGGVIGQTEARQRTEELVAELQKYREFTGDLWDHYYLVLPVLSQHYRGLCENDVKVLIGSNSGFLQETLTLPTHLDKNFLYLVRKDSNKVLTLLPLLRVEFFPQSANSACYFYNRIEKHELRYVSYHHIDPSFLMFTVDDAPELMALLQENGEL